MSAKKLDQESEAIIAALIERKKLVGERRAEYLSALGEFADSFAATESFLHLCFPKLSKLKYAVAMAVKGSMRLSDLISLTKRLMPVAKWSDSDIAAMGRLFDQLNAISEFRDRVLHRGASLLPDGRFSSSNVATMKSLELLEFVDFTVDDIRNASADLALIRQLVGLVVYRKNTVKRFGLKLTQEAERQPWRYKPVKPELARLRFLKAHQARARQQKPSQE